MSDQVIIDAFETQVLAFEAASGIPIIWPGLKADEPSEGDWVEFKLFPQAPAPMGRSASDSKLYRGYLQATVCRHSGKGVQRPANVADQIAAFFPMGAQMQSGPHTVKVSRPVGLSAVFEDDGKIKMTVPIYYTAII